MFSAFSAMSLVIMSMAVVLTSPQWMVVCLVAQSILVVIFIACLKSLWYSYLLFLVFMGGILIIFVYISGLVSTNKMEFITGGMLGSSGLVLFLFFMVGKFAISWSSLLIEPEVNSLSWSYTINNIISYWCAALYLFIVVYLFVALYAVCSIVKENEGPLRLLS